MTPYYEDDAVTLYHGDCLDLPESIQADLIVTDPPYGETSLAWDHWPKGWPTLASLHSRSMWCFGSMRMFLEQRDEFAKWRLSQDVVWEKSRAGLVTNRFARVHEYALHWYQGDWASLGHQQPKERHYGKKVTLTRPGKYQGVYGGIGQDSSWEDDGHRAIRSVMKVASVRQGQASGINPTEKPTGILEPLIKYGCPEHGLVLDMFAGSGSTLAAAKGLGRRAIGIEMREDQCESAALRLSQGVLDFEEPA